MCVLVCACPPPPSAAAVQVLSSAVHRWHFRMLNDGRRNAAYAAAIEEAVAARRAELQKREQGGGGGGGGTAGGPGVHVLDIGTGTGLLAMLAARSAPSTRVWACDSSAVMVELARRCVQANGCTMPSHVTAAGGSHAQPDGGGGGGGGVEVWQALSTNVGVHGEESGGGGAAAAVQAVLERRVDLVVSEILDAGLLGEHVLPALRHAATRLLRPPPLPCGALRGGGQEERVGGGGGGGGGGFALAGRLIPCAATVWGACVRSADLRERLYVSHAAARQLRRLLLLGRSGCGRPAAAEQHRPADCADSTAEGRGAKATASQPPGSEVAADGVWLRRLADAVGLEDGEAYETTWLHRLRECTCVEKRLRASCPMPCVLCAAVPCQPAGYRARGVGGVRGRCAPKRMDSFRNEQVLVGAVQAAGSAFWSTASANAAGDTTSSDACEHARPTTAEGGSRRADPRPFLGAGRTPSVVAGCHCVLVPLTS
jgi:SAM-dependent methyltransferase